MPHALLPVAALAVVVLVWPISATSPGPVAAADKFACALFERGAVKCWGYNKDNGQLGIGSTAKSIGGATGQMGDDLRHVLLGTGAVAVKIATGGLHACAILDTSKIKCWGQNENGQLGLGDTSSRGTDAAQMDDNLPIVDVGNNSSYEAIEIACGTFHTCAILFDGRLKC